jgi:hypothetical protein
MAADAVRLFSNGLRLELIEIDLLAMLSDCGKDLEGNSQGASPVLQVHDWC